MLYNTPFVRLSLFLVSILLLVGCNTTPPPPKPWTSVQVKRDEIAETLIVDFPEDWELYDPADTPFDKQAKSADQKLNTGVFFYSRSEFKEGTDLDRALSLQVDDLGSKRQEWRVVRAPETIEKDGYHRASTVYSGKKNAEEFYYRFSAIESDQHKDVIATTLQVAFPERYGDDEGTLQRITDSIRFKGE